MGNFLIAPRGDKAASKEAALKNFEMIQRGNAENKQAHEASPEKSFLEKMASGIPKHNQRTVADDMAVYRRLADENEYAGIDPEKHIGNHPEHGKVRHGDVVHQAKAMGIKPIQLMQHLMDSGMEPASAAAKTK